MNGEEEAKREALKGPYKTGLPLYDVMRKAEDWRRDAPPLSADNPGNPQDAPPPPEPPLSPPPLPPPPPPPPGPPLEELSGIVVRTGVLFRRYFLKVKDAEARPGDVLVVVGREWYVLRPTQRTEVWVGDGVIKLRGEAVRFPINAIPHRVLLDCSAQIAWGKTALIAAKVPRARLKWPKRYDPEVSPFARDLAEIAQSPALVALVRLSDKGAKKTALSWLSKGSYAYCHAVNQLLQQVGVGVRLIC